MAASDEIEICSYRRVFDLERRVYRIDRLRLNPGGVPVRGIAYFLATVALVLAVARVPWIRVLASWIPWYARDLVLPAFVAALLMSVRVGGRPFHLAVQGLARYARGPRRLVALRACRNGAPGSRWYPPPVLLLPDGSDGRLRRVRYEGPGAARVSVPHVRSDRRREWTVSGRRCTVSLRRPGTADPRESHSVIVLDRGVRLTVRP